MWKTKVLDVPVAFNEDGDAEEHTITIKGLSPRSLKAAAIENQRLTLNDIKGMRGDIRELQAEIGKGPKEDDKKDEDEKDPLVGYDLVTLFTKAITAWSYQKPIDADALENITAGPAEWLGLEILRLAKPELVQTKDEREQEKVKG